jgi:glycerophosphoryl diester phosphodiesterase
MKRISFIFATILFLLTAVNPKIVVSQNDKTPSRLHLITVKTARELQSLFRYSKSTFPIVGAHRGGPQVGYPENCIRTFENTLKSTFAVMECDPRYTKDSVLILNHDPYLQRTTTGKGNVKDFTLQELKALRLKDTKGNVTDCQITTLDEALEWAKGKTILVLDQKDVPVVQRLKKVEEHQAEANVIIIAYSFQEALECYKLNNDIMMEVMIPNAEKLNEFDKLGVPWKNVIAFVGHNLPEDPKLYELIHQKGVICEAGSSRTIDPKYLRGDVKDFALLKDDYSGFLDKGIDMIETDTPTYLGTLLYKDSKVKSKYCRYE